ncbi:MAG TPA: hypothetical protein VFO89_02455 [Thermoanaerobaculia bacterium]|nr:hypothetical protein [Thermoanaerobaculia bacterium]
MTADFGYLHFTAEEAMLRKLVGAVLSSLLIVLPSAASDDRCLTASDMENLHFESAAPLFPTAPAEIHETAAGTFLRTSIPEVLVARIGADGKLVISCVDSAEAVKRIMESPHDIRGNAPAEKQ